MYIHICLYDRMESMTVEEYAADLVLGELR